MMESSLPRAALLKSVFNSLSLLILDIHGENHSLHSVENVVFFLEIKHSDLFTYLWFFPVRAHTLSSYKTRRAPRQ